YHRRDQSALQGDQLRRIVPMRSRAPRWTRRRHSSRPTLEGLESRELPSSAMPRPSTHERPAIVAHPDSANGLIGKKAPGSLLDPAILRQAAAALYHANVPPGTPTRREIRRQTFTARWVGQYTIGPPRFSDRASTIYLYGVSGGSNQFLKGKFQIAIF